MDEAAAMSPSAEEARPVGAGLKSASVAAGKAPPGIIARVFEGRLPDPQ
jgi:hypothetical protein